MRIADLIARERWSTDIDDDATFARVWERVERLAAEALDVCRWIDARDPLGYEADVSNDLHAAAAAVMPEDWDCGPSNPDPSLLPPGAGERR